MIFLQIYFNIFIFLIADYRDLLYFSFLNKLNFFPKLVNNIIIFIISNIFLFITNYTIDKNTT